MKKNVLLMGVCAIASLFTTKLNAQVPDANFSISQNTVCVGTTVQLNDLSTYTPTAWSYTVDGVGVFTTANPTISFASSGIYNVTLISTNGDGDSSPLSQTISVNPLPIIAAGIDLAVCAGDLITVNASGATNYTWTAGVTDGVPFTPLATTVYTVTGEDVNGCINYATKSVTVNALPVLSILSNTSICLGESITQTVSGASSYTWDTGSNSNVLIDSPTSNMNYSVTGLDALTGCINTVSNFITVFNLPSVSVNSGVVCTGQNFILVPNGANTYVYSGGSNSVSPAANTSYTVTGTDVNGCVASAVSDVTVLALPSISVNSASICSGTSFTLIPSGAATYTFSNGSNVVSPLTTTSYSVSGTDINGCESSALAIAEITVVASPIISVNTGSICAGDSFTMNPTGASTYTYSNGTNIVSPSSNTSYTISGSDVNGCVSNDAVASITVFALPVVNVNSGSICSGSVFTLNPTGASSYVFSNGTALVNPIVNTSYSVTGISLQGCNSANTAVSDVTVLALPIISVNSASICSGTSFTLNPTGATSYTFSNGSNVVSPLTTTSYSVSGADNNGCISSAIAVAEITVVASPVVSVNTGSICSGDSFTINPTGASTYTFSNGTNIVSPTSNTSYTINGSDLNGCVSNNAVVSITVFALPVVSVNSGSLCVGSVFTLNPTGANAYVFSNGSTTVNPLVNSSYSVTGVSLQGCNSANTAVANLTVIALPVVAVNSGSICAGNSFTLLPTGASNYVISGGVNVVSPISNTSYSITGTNAFGCISSNTAIASITVNSLPVLSISGNSTICAGQSAVLNASGASTYSWSNTNVVPTITITPALTTSIAVTGTNLFGCVSSLVQTIVVNQLPVLSVNGPTAICSGETASLNVSGASTYTWNGSVNASSLVVTPNANTTFSIIGTDANACNANLVYSLVVNALPSLTLANASICPGNSYTLIPSGAVSYTYSSGSAVITPVSTATYTVIGSDLNGCTSMVTVTVSVVNTVTLSVTGATTICNGQSTNLNASGATTYSWSTNATTNTVTLNPSVSSTYTITGTTGNCTNKTVVTVSVNALPVISVTSTKDQICSGESVTLTGYGASSYSWTSGATTNIIAVNPSVTSTYTVYGTDANSCTNLANFTQNVNACTGIAKLNSPFTGIQVYPNPFQGEFSIQLTEQAFVNVVNALGQIVYQANLNAGTTAIDLNSQINGLYFVQIKQGSDVKTLKLIKN